MKTNKQKLEDFINQDPVWETQAYELLIVRSESGVWSFSDESLNIVNEPFVCGINEIIDQIFRDAGFDPRAGTKALIEFAQHAASALRDKEGVYELLLEPNDYHKYPDQYTPVIYYCKNSEKVLHGGFCPVFFTFFPREVKGIKVRIKEIV